MGDDFGSVGKKEQEPIAHNCCRCGGRAQIPRPIRDLHTGRSYADNQFYCFRCWDEIKEPDWRDQLRRDVEFLERERYRELGIDEYRKEALSRYKTSRLAGTGSRGRRSGD